MISVKISRIGFKKLGQFGPIWAIVGSKAVNTGHVGEKGDHRAQSGSTGGHRWPFGVHIGSLGAKGGP